MTRAVIVALAAASVLVALLFWARQRAPEPSPQAERTRARPAPSAVTDAPAPAASARDASQPLGAPGAAQDDTNPTQGEPGAAPAASAGAATPSAPPMSFIRRDYESEPRDADAVVVERRIREIYAATPDAEGVLREVRCTRSVCRLDARWSPELNAGYNAALVEMIGELSREVSFEPGGAPEGQVMPMALYIRRPAPAQP